MSQTLVSVDLDWLNGAPNPMVKLKNLLGYIPTNIPVVFTVEHHEFLPKLRRWVGSGKVPIPFNVINVDEHHDFYYQRIPYHPEGHGTNCGNWGYRIPKKWYSRYTWIHNGRGEFQDWDDVQEWFTKNGIDFSERDRLRFSELNLDICATIFCVSPDYLDPEILKCIPEVVEMVVKHFGLRRAPKIIEGRTTIHDLNSWRMAPRPVSVG